MLITNINLGTTSDSQGRAEQNLRRLTTQVATLLRENQALNLLLTASKSCLTSRSSLDTTSFRATLPDLAENLLVRSQLSISSAESRLVFEQDLKQSRVYRRAKRVSLDVSMRSSVDRSHGWSIFTGLSLGKISNISVLALPIHARDIPNLQHYNFNLGLPQYPHIMGSISLPSEPLGELDTVECLEVQRRLSGLEIYPYTEHLVETTQQLGENADPISTLIDMFRCGTPLLTLLIYGAGRVHNLPVANVDLQLKSAGWDGWGLLAELLDACLGCLGTAQVPFTLSDLMDPAMHSQMRVRVPNSNPTRSSVTIHPLLIVDNYFSLGSQVCPSSPDDHTADGTKRNTIVSAVGNY